MLRRLIWTAGVAASLLSSIPGCLPGARAQTAGGAAAEAVLVERVLDGDTVIIKGWRERVRLANIDAPERSHGYGRPGQPFSVQSAEKLADLVEGRSGIAVSCVDQDRYGRPVCDFYRSGMHVNKELVRAGLAWANTSNPRYLRDRSVLAAQQQAKKERQGLWADPRAVAPWEWRRQCWDR